MSDNNFSALGQVVTEAKNLLDTIKGGAIRVMKNTFEQMTVTMNSDFSHVLSDIQNQANTVLGPTVQSMAASLNQWIYVDGIAGNDLNLGTESQPLKTIDAAISRALPCGMMRILLTRGQRFEGPSGQSVAGLVSLIFGAYGAGSVNPVVYPKKEIWRDDSNDAFILGTFVRSESSQVVNIAFMDVDVETLRLESDEKPYLDFGAFCARGSGDSEMFDFNVTFYGSKVTIFDTALFGGYAGFIKIRLVNSEIHRASGSVINQLCYSASRQCPKMIDALASRFVGFETPTAEAVLGIKGQNTLINMTGVVFE